MHGEGAPDAVQALMPFLGDVVPTERARIGGYEQFAIRGVSTAVFVVQEQGRPPTTTTCDWRSTA